MNDRVETVVIGGGQAGLAISYHLGRLGRAHIVLEQGRVAERWRSERWDSLAFQFPNWMMRLPGFAYDGADPEGFMHRDGVVRFISDYAERIGAPLQCGTRVTALRQSAADGRLTVETEDFDIEATNVVVATGAYQQPSVPSLSAGVPDSIHQITANLYRNPDQLPRGVLVVGSGASGCQIAEDLLQGGQDVFLSVGRHRRVPRRYRGKDFGWWQETTGFADTTREALPANFLPPLLSGVGGGRDVDLRRLASDGVRLVGSLSGASAGQLFFAQDLEANLAMGDEGVRSFKRSVDEFVAVQGLDVPADQPSDTVTTSMLSSIPKLELSSAGIRAIIWATGYRNDFGWIKAPVFDEGGKLVHRRGVTCVPGLYFLGLPRLHKVKSSFLWGVGEDAAYLARHIVTRAQRTEAPRTTPSSGP